MAYLLCCVDPPTQFDDTLNVLTFQPNVVKFHYPRDALRKMRIIIQQHQIELRHKRRLHWIS